MRINKIQKNVESGQCKGALLRIQVRTTAIFFFSGIKLWFKNGFSGSKIGIFAPSRYENGRYQFRKFYFRPWLAADIPVSHLPTLYRKIARACTFGRP